MTSLDNNVGLAILLCKHFVVDLLSKAQLM